MDGSHLVKVKVTGANKVKISIPAMYNSVFIKHGVMKFACTVQQGFWLWWTAIFVT